MASFESKVTLLSDLYTNYQENDLFDDFIAYNDIGCPLAYFIETKLCEVTPQGKLYIDETYSLLMELLGTSKKKTYKSVEDLISSVSHE